VGLFHAGPRCRTGRMSIRKKVLVPFVSLDRLIMVLGISFVPDQTHLEGFGKTNPSITSQSYASLCIEVKHQHLALANLSNSRECVSTSWTIYHL
jgi:hypothetical protein